MTAKKNGPTGWNIETDGDPDLELKKLEMKADFITPKILEQMQLLVQILVQLESPDRLLNLLSCTREVFKQADDAMSKGARMEISDKYQGDETIQ